MWTRRRFLNATGTAGAAAVLPRATRAQSTPDVELRLTAAKGTESLYPGTPTPILRFTGEVLAGRADALRPAGGYLGPTLDLRRGERVRVHFRNRLPEPSVVHWHGMLVPEAADGHPRLAIGAGADTTVEFTVNNPAGTYLYHPHPHGRTGFQVYYGLAGLLIVREALEPALGLPPPEFELPLVIQDRRVGADNTLHYGGSMMDAMDGMLGDTVLVNGRPDALLQVRRRAYRLRIVNVSNARIYKLAWSDGEPLHVVSSGSGLHGAGTGVQVRPYVVLSPSERVEVIEDFGRRSPGAEIALASEAFDVPGGMGHGRMGGGMMGRGMMGRGGMRGGMMGRGAGPGGGVQGEPMLIARFAVAREAAERPPEVKLPPAEALTDPVVERHTELGFFHMQGTLNGRSFEMEAVAPDERVPVGRTCAWTFSNPAQMMMSMPHPMHIHGVRFSVLARSGGSGGDLRAGIVDAGFKDTVLVLPGERVTVAFTPPEPGLFLYHCHNLEHEDGGMMRNVLFG
jgi:bilirubin oxidase